MMMKNNDIVVAGAVNMDIGGKSDKSLREKDSNPGIVKHHFGGVARNIAHNLVKWNQHVAFLTVLGQDGYGDDILESCCDLGIDMSSCLRSKSQKTSTYLYISNPQGEMQLAISDMKITNELTPDYFLNHLSLINQAKVLVLDGNLPQESLLFLAKETRSAIFADPVSVSKADKFQDILPFLHSFKPNKHEAEALSGIKIMKESDVQRVADFFLEKGVKNIYLSLGAEGVYCANKNQRLWLKNSECRIVNTTGAGDSFLAGLVWAYCHGCSFEESARCAQRAALYTCQHEETVHPLMNEEIIKGEKIC